MELWKELEAALKERGVREDQRLALLSLVRTDEDLDQLRLRLETAVERLDEAAARLRREARGR